MRTWTKASAWVVVSCVAACAGNSGSNGPGSTGTLFGSSGGASSGNGSSGASSGDTSSNGGSSSGDFSSSGNSSNGSSSSSPSSSGSSGTSSGSSGTSGSGGTSGASGSSGTSGSSSSGGSGGGACDIPQRGGDPTSTSASAPGPYQTTSYAANASVRSTMAYDVTSAHIYYPTGATAPYASIAIVPGWTAAESSIADWGPFLASWGFVVMTIGTSNPSTGATDASVDQNVRASALLDAITTLQGENTRSGSPLNGKLDTTRQAVAGWSKGGGGALIAANKTPTLKAAFGMEPWNVDLSANVGTYPMDTVPILIFAGTADTLAGPPMPQTQYTSIPSTTSKLLYEVQGGSHQVSTSPTNSTTDMAPDSTSTPTIARFGLSWLKVFLECDMRFRPFLLVKPSDAADYQTTLM